MGKVLQKNGKPNRQTERTKSWIFDALMLLMDEKPYMKISVSDITKRAGIARTTFYRNYKNINDIFLEFFSKIMSAKFQSRDKDNTDKGKNEIIIVLDYKYMIEHKKTLRKIILNTDIEIETFQYAQTLPIKIMESYKKNLSAEEYLYCRFKLCYQLAGSIKVISDWYINNMQIPIEKLISMINFANNPKKAKYTDFPNIVVQLKE